MKLKLPSISTLANNTFGVLRRFPVEAVIALVATVTAITLVESDPEANTPYTLIRILCFCLLALSVTLACDLFAEARNFPALKTWMLRGESLVVCVVIMLFLDPALRQADLIVFFIFAIAFHLMVSYAAFLGKGAIGEFWHFNKALFLRLVVSGLYSAAIVAGLFAAVTATRYLFKLDIDDKIYAEIFLSTAFLFNTWFFLAGMPDVKNSAVGDKTYPKGLKLFTQYVLVPLMTVYLVILILYEIKIITDRELPDGYVGWLIMGYSFFGILSLLLVYPIKNNPENKWINWFSRFFYIMLVPLLILLFFAIYERVNSYGITELRYALIALAVWLSGITLYFLFSGKDNIKIIPLSLSIVALIAAVGPQSATSVSAYSQLGRLKKAVSQYDDAEAVKIVDYLISSHGLKVLQPLTKANLARIEEDVLSNKHIEKNPYTINNIMRDTAYRLLHIENNTQPADISYYQSEKYGRAVEKITGFDYYVNLTKFSKDKDLNIGDGLGVIKRDDEFLSVSIAEHGDLLFNIDSLKKAITQSIQAYGSGGNYYFADSAAVMVRESPALLGEFRLRSFSSSKNNDMDALEGALLIRLK